MGFVVFIIIVFIVIGIYQKYKENNSNGSSTYNSNKTYSTPKSSSNESGAYDQTLLGYKIKSLNSKNRTYAGGLKISARMEKLVFEQSTYDVL